MSHECSECTFVNAAESILIKPEVFKNLSHRPVYVGKFTMPGWVGHANFYAFKCPKCSLSTTDYPHGYTDGGRLYFNQDHSSNCKVSDGERSVLPINDAKIYRAEGIKSPSSGVREISSISVTRVASLAIVVTVLLLLVSQIKC